MKTLKLLARIMAFAFFWLAVGVMGENLTLRWDPNPPEDNVMIYLVYFRNNAFPGATFGRVGSTTNAAWTWTNAPTGSFSFYLIATNSAGESPPSNVITNTSARQPVPVAPQNLRVSTL